MGHVWIIVHHYDRGSDEVSLEGAYTSLEKAMDAFAKEFPSYKPSPEVIEEMDGHEYPPNDWWYYADIDWTDGCDRAMIIHQEVN